MSSIYTRITEEAAVLLSLKRYVLLLLFLSVLANALLSAWFFLRNDDTRTIVLSPAATETYIATEKSVSPNLLERFAIESLNLVLNVTPATASFQTERFLKAAAPESYTELASMLRLGAADLERNQAALAFFPMASSIDAEKGRVCVKGLRKTLIGKTVAATETVTACVDCVVRSGRLWIAALQEVKGEKPLFTQSPSKESP